MSKCYIAIKVICVILFYIVSLSAIVIGSMLAFFDAALDGFVVYDNIFDIIDRYLKQLNLDGTPVVVFGVALILPACNRHSRRHIPQRYFQSRKMRCQS